MIPSVGRTVEYTLSGYDEGLINHRRLTKELLGNPVYMGQKYPLVITKVWGDPASESTSVNGQVLLDGEDTLWVTSRQQGDQPSQWQEFPRV